MAGRGDLFIMAIMGILLIIGIISLLKKWLQNPVIGRNLSIPFSDYIPDHPAVELLQNNGFEVVGGRVKIPLYFEVDHEDYYSRLFIDYVATDDEGAVYLVKTARKRMPQEWTGSSLRDRLLPYFLLYPDCAGVLYVDVNEVEIRRIYFEWDEEEWNGHEG